VYEGLAVMPDVFVPEARHVRRLVGAEQLGDVGPVGFGRGLAGRTAEGDQNGRVISGPTA
jgi:hypothetical protein